MALSNQDRKTPEKPQSMVAAVVGVVVAGLVGTGLYYLRSPAAGTPATQAQVIGLWEYSGDMHLAIDFASNGHFERRGTNGEVTGDHWGTTIPERGDWHVDAAGVLVMGAGGAGSFKPYRDGDKLTLAAEADPHVVYKFHKVSSFDGVGGNP